MGRLVVLLIAPVIIGIVIAAGVVLIHGWLQRRVDARLALEDPTIREVDEALEPGEHPAGRSTGTEQEEIRRSA
jgi:hypothetical protein